MAKSIDEIIKEYTDNQQDFGFTITNQSEIDTKDLTIADYKGKLQKIEELIMPLLANLHSTADSPVINWPNRKELLDKKIKEFLILTRD